MGIAIAQAIIEAYRVGVASVSGRIWDAATGKEIATLSGHENIVQSAAFSPDGRRIVTASWDRTARIWDAATAKEIVSLRGHDANVMSAAFSFDGLRIVTASWDGTARIWDAETGAEIADLRGHNALVQSAAFSHDQTRVVTGAFDFTARVWDVRLVMTSPQKLMLDVCSRRLHGVARLNLDLMHLAGYGDDTSEIDVCAGVQ